MWSYILYYVPNGYMFDFVGLMIDSKQSFKQREKKRGSSQSDTDSYWYMYKEYKLLIMYGIAYIQVKIRDMTPEYRGVEEGEEGGGETRELCV